MQDTGKAASVAGPSSQETQYLCREAAWPRISVVTPSFNQGQFLERTIRSVLSQDYPNLEYLIMDGGSTDDSVQIIRKYEGDLAYWTSGKDAGQTDAIVRGFARSTGTILAYLNSDDTYTPGALREVARAFLRDPGCDLVFGNTNYIDAADQVIGECRFTPFDFATLIYEGSGLHQPSAFWTSDAYHHVGGLNPKYHFCMDYDFFCRVGQKGQLRHIRRALANFRIHEASKSSTIVHTGALEHEEIARRYRRTQNRIYRRCRRSACQVRRLLHYVAQGDADYAMRGLRKRLLRVLGRTSGTYAH